MHSAEITMLKGASGGVPTRTIFVFPSLAALIAFT
jgi:hypothetical protein